MSTPSASADARLRSQAALRRLWEACFPDEDFSGSPTRRWTDAGFQGADPSRDFRGGGIYSLLNLIYMSQHYGGVFQRLLHKTDGTRSEIEYPFSVAGAHSAPMAFSRARAENPRGKGHAPLCLRDTWSRQAAAPLHNRRTNLGPRCAGINITYRLEELIELRAASGAMITRPPQTPAAASFARLLALESAAFEELYVAAFQVLDSKWLEARASYMQFPMVLDATMDAVRGALAARPESVAALRAKLGLVNV